MPNLILLFILSYYTISLFRRNACLELDEQGETLEVGTDMGMEQVIVAELNIEEVLPISIEDVHAVLESGPAIDIDEAIGGIDNEQWSLF